MITCVQCRQQSYKWQRDENYGYAELNARIEMTQLLLPRFDVEESSNTDGSSSHTHGCYHWPVLLQSVSEAKMRIGMVSGWIFPDMDIKS